MQNDRLAGWLTFSANIAVLIGIVLIIVELDQNRDSMRAQTRNEISTNIVQLLSMCGPAALNESMTDLFFVRAHFNDSIGN